MSAPKFDGYETIHGRLTEHLKGQGVTVEELERCVRRTLKTGNEESLTMGAVKGQCQSLLGIELKPVKYAFREFVGFIFSDMCEAAEKPKEEVQEAADDGHQATSDIAVQGGGRKRQQEVDGILDENIRFSDSRADAHPSLDADVTADVVTKVRVQKRRRRRGKTGIQSTAGDGIVDEEDPTQLRRSTRVPRHRMPPIVPRDGASSSAALKDGGSGDIIDRSCHTTVLSDGTRRTVYYTQGNWCARWVHPTGARKTKSFACTKWGEEAARGKALEAELHQSDLLLPAPQMRRTDAQQSFGGNGKKGKRGSRSQHHGGEGECGFMYESTESSDGDGGGDGSRSFEVELPCRLPRHPPLLPAMKRRRKWSAATWEEILTDDTAAGGGGAGDTQTTTTPEEDETRLRGGCVYGWLSNTITHDDDDAMDDLHEIEVTNDCVKTARMLSQLSTSIREGPTLE